CKSVVTTSDSVAGVARLMVAERRSDEVGGVSDKWTGTLTWVVDAERINDVLRISNVIRNRVNNALHESISVDEEQVLINVSLSPTDISTIGNIQKHHPQRS